MRVPPADELLTVSETVEFLKLESRQALYWLNYTGTGPSYFRIGREIRYRRSEILAWLEGQRATPKAS